MSTLRPREDDPNPFRPPAAPLEAAPDSATRFFTASPLKFVVMSIVTFSLYCLYWFYKSFKVMRETTSPKVMPFWRAIFSVIWSYSAFSATHARRAYARRGPLGGGLFVALVLTGLFAAPIQE